MARRSAPYSASARWPNTWTSRSPTTRSAQQEPGRYRRRGRTRRHLRGAHQSAGRAVRCRCDRARLQGPRRCRACLPFDENRRSGAPPGIPLDRTTGARACAALYARVHVEWRMRRSLAPMLFDEHDPIGRDAQRASPVAKAKPSLAARRKAATKQTDMAHGEPLPVHSFRTLLADLATMTRNTVRLGRDCLDACRPLQPRRSAERSICSA